MKTSNAKKALTGTILGVEAFLFLVRLPCELFLDLEKKDLHPRGDLFDRPLFLLPRKQIQSWGNILNNQQLLQNIDL